MKRTAPKQQFDSEGRPLCRRCQKLVPKRFRSYCSTECRTEFEIAYFPSSARRALRKRDHGVCAICGTDTDLIRRIFRKIPKDIRNEVCRDILPLLGFRSSATLKGGAFWQVDHILECVNGGWGTTLPNMQTSCTPCHKARTAKLAADRAAKRKAVLQPVNLTS